ncbi:hypothetical protein SAMN05518847_11216 [Paenibacillus sp. OV219]|nr:hypothetical protein SAMN05518847_11216 [Paenibacillus sp. OV219]
MNSTRSNGVGLRLPLGKLTNITPINKKNPSHRIRERDFVILLNLERDFIISLHFKSDYVSCLILRVLCDLAYCSG